MFPLHYDFFLILTKCSLKSPYDSSKPCITCKYCKSCVSSDWFIIFIWASCFTLNSNNKHVCLMLWNQHAFPSSKCLVWTLFCVFSVVLVSLGTRMKLKLAVAKITISRAAQHQFQHYLMLVMFLALGHPFLLLQRWLSPVKFQDIFITIFHSLFASLIANGKKGASSHIFVKSHAPTGIDALTSEVWTSPMSLLLL